VHGHAVKSPMRAGQAWRVLGGADACTRPRAQARMSMNCVRPIRRCGNATTSWVRPPAFDRCSLALARACMHACMHAGTHGYMRMNTYTRRDRHSLSLSVPFVVPPSAPSFKNTHIAQAMARVSILAAHRHRNPWPWLRAPRKAARSCAQICQTRMEKRAHTCM